VTLRQHLADAALAIRGMDRWPTAEPAIVSPESRRQAAMLTVTIQKPNGESETRHLADGDRLYLTAPGPASTGVVAAEALYHESLRAAEKLRCEKEDALADRGDLIAEIRGVMYKGNSAQLQTALGRILDHYEAER